MENFNGLNLGRFNHPIMWGMFITYLIWNYEVPLSIVTGEKIEVISFYIMKFYKQKLLGVSKLTWVFLLNIFYHLIYDYIEGIIYKLKTEGIKFKTSQKVLRDAAEHNILNLVLSLVENKPELYRLTKNSGIISDILPLRFDEVLNYASTNSDRTQFNLEFKDSEERKRFFQALHDINPTPFESIANSIGPDHQIGMPFKRHLRKLIKKVESNREPANA